MTALYQMDSSTRKLMKIMSHTYYFFLLNVVQGINLVQHLKEQIYLLGTFLEQVYLPCTRFIFYVLSQNKFIFHVPSVQDEAPNVLIHQFRTKMADICLMSSFC